MPTDNSQERVPCPNVDINKEKCSCKSKNCSRQGFCCECVEYHKSKGQLPVCLRDLK
jgi:hypothetical protein